MAAKERRKHAGRLVKDHTQSPPNQRLPPIRPRWTRLPTTSLLLIISTIILLSCAPASAFERERYAVRRLVLDEQWVNDIVFDARPAPQPELVKRQFDPGSDSDSSSKEESSSKKDKPTSTKEEAPSSTSGGETTGTGGIVSAPTASNSELPTAFDGGLGTNFTQPGCLTFLQNMLKNDTVTRCLPVSLLLQNSQSFFQQSRSSKSLDPILTASCNVDQKTCSSVMASQALSLRSSSACSQDYDRQQPSVRQAYNGLVSYDLLYQAVCTKATPSAQNNNSADFCYTNAVTNTSSPTDAYIYFLPLGVSLPAGSLPTCSECLKETMGFFGPVSRNKSQPISLTYMTAAQQVNLNCGPNFVNQSIPGAGGTGAATSVQPRLGAILLTAVTGFLAQAILAV